ncbi:hypothetical protein BJ138DRAFT_927669 [Hygrophoropsis aurantiaca]|uniref:Uncharacterized protein n=1 Tax=Hygrophoropsis aurantiaca TaxID=72124 RepID=A0ACB7ZUG8_9AGAM|nr:hypothetical protein BJ138DRAFT_927669 [Hygrophoropsis aurantiaca]
MENREITFQHLVEKAISGSIEHIQFLGVKCGELPTPQAEGGMILRIFISHLNPALIPQRITPETARVIDLAKWSLLGIINFGAGLEPEEQVFEHVLKNWARLHPWISFFYHNFLADLSVARAQVNSLVSISEAVKITIGFLSILHDSFPSVRPQFANTPALRTTIMGIWILATDIQPRDLNLDGPDQNSAEELSLVKESISRVAVYCLAYDATVTTFPAFVAAAGGLSAIVNTTLEYLRVFRKEVEGSASKAQPLLMDSSWVNYSTHLAQITEVLFIVSEREAVAREEFISKGSVHIIASMLAQLHAKLPEHPIDRTYPRGYEYIQHAMLESEDGPSVLCEALEARILDTILQAGHMNFDYNHDYRRDQESDVELLSRLPHLLMHTKVLRMAAKSLSWIKLQDTERHARHDRVLLNAWDNFKGAVARYLRTEKRLRSIKRPTYESACGGDQECQCISRGETKPELYRCSGCLLVKYCSRRCQRTDWKRRHGAQCRIIRLAIGTSESHDIRRNLLMIAAIEAEERIPEGAPLERFLDDARRRNPDYRACNHLTAIRIFSLEIADTRTCFKTFGMLRTILSK